MEANSFNQLFSRIKYACSAVSALMLIWLIGQLFIPAIGGPFPQRTRGPLADNRYDRLSELPQWENMIQPDPATGRTQVEALIESGNIPSIKFGAPSIIHDATDSASGKLLESLQNNAIRKATQ